MNPFISLGWAVVAALMYIGLAVIVMPYYFEYDTPRILEQHVFFWPPLAPLLAWIASLISALAAIGLVRLHRRADVMVDRRARNLYRIGCAILSPTLLLANFTGLLTLPGLLALVFSGWAFMLVAVRELRRETHRRRALIAIASAMVMLVTCLMSLLFRLASLADSSLSVWGIYMWFASIVAGSVYGVAAIEWMLRARSLFV